MAKLAAMSKQGTRFVFTLWNPSPEEIDAIDAIKERFKFIIGGLETAPTTGMIHLQGYLEVKSRTRMSTIQKLINKKCHLEIANGTREQNQIDCSKENNVIIYFEEPRTLTKREEKYAKLIEATKLKTRLEVAVEFPVEFIRHNGVVERLLAEQ
jgi:hypothetical protein